MRPQRGFTLAELVAGLGLVAIVATGAALAQREWRASLRLHWAGQQVGLDLQRARMRAVAENTDYRVVFSVGERHYRMQRFAAGAFVDVDGGAVLPADVRTASCTAPGQIVRFRPKGNAATFGTIALRNDAGAERRIIVNIAGRVRIEG